MIELLLLVSGASLMALELTASRILSPYIGSSIYVWTAIIGIIMAALSGGYYWGGKLSNKKLELALLSNLVFLTGLSILLTFLVKDYVLMWILQFVRDTRISAGLAGLLLFAPASFLFGTITPYATRLKLEKISNSGEIVGKLYAISTVGSIVGTFLTGYFLLGYLGSSKILIALGVLMVIGAALIDSKNFFKIKKILLILFFCILIVGIGERRNKNVVFEGDSNYQKIFVFDSNEKDTKRPIRLLRTSILAQSGRYLDGDDLLFEYIRQLTLVDHFKPNAEKMLFIGGGGYSLPSYFVNKKSQLSVDVVELDPQVSKVAKKYFDVPQTERITSFDIDGRSFVNSTTKKYDVIILDAYRDEFAMPFELTTAEAVQRYSDLLNDDGFLAINIISSLTGPRSEFLRAEYKTLKTFFPNILIFQANPDRDANNIQNIEVFAFKSSESVDIKSKDLKYQKLLSHLWEGSLESDNPVLTDDFAPVERYMLAAF